MPAPLGVLRPPATIITPTLLLGAAGAFAADGLGLAARFLPQGLAVALISCLVLTALSTIQAAAGDARKARSVFFLFLPALAFPSLPAALLSIVAFLFWWLARAASLGDAHALSRSELLGDLGLPERSSVPWSVPTKGILLSRLRASAFADSVGLGCMAAAALCVPSLVAFQGSTRLVGALVFFLASVASWEQVFKAFHLAGTRSPR